MENTLNLHESLKQWNGKSADKIKETFNKFKEDPSFSCVLLELIHDPICQKGATWLLKAWLNEGSQLDAPQTAKILDNLNILTHWEAKLHVLQCLPFLTVGSAQKKAVEAYLRITLTDQNKFIRAWSYHGFYELARQYPEYQTEVKQFLEMAMNDEVASVKARIRNIIKKGF